MLAHWQRFIRNFRLTRMLGLVSELQTLVVSFASSMALLIWIVILLGLRTYSFGMFLTNVVISTRQSTPHEVTYHGRARRNFCGGTAQSRAMLSLFESVASGVSWADAMDPLSVYVSPWLIFAFVGCIIFVIRAFLNVVTGMFVEVAGLSARERTKVVLCQRMCEMFVVDHMHEAPLPCHFLDVVGNGGSQRKSWWAAFFDCKVMPGLWHLQLPFRGSVASASSGPCMRTA